MKSRLGAMSPKGGAVEFPSQRRERIDWHKLASIDLHELNSGCSIEILQENLSHVAFCDSEVEFDLRTTAGQRSLLKMFRLSQLMVQYLFLSQEFLETQLQEVQVEAQKSAEKYQQIKAKLIQQVEEAKKMKSTNKNMRETVKYVNSFALANGIFQSVKCPVCPKMFRGQDFLHSHLWRKHPTQANSATVPQVMPVPSAVPSGPVVLNEAANTETNKIQEIPQNNATPVHSAPSGPSSNTNDVDSYRLAEIEKKFNAMNDNFMRIMRGMEEQKLSLEKENKKKQEEVRTAWAEKQHMEQCYETQLEKLNDQIAHLQSVTRTQAPSSDTERFLELVQKQQEEIRSLQAQVRNTVSADDKVVEIRDTDALDGLSNEIFSLKKQLNEQKKSHKVSLKHMQESLQKDYEKALSTEKQKLMETMKDIMDRQTPVTVISHKPPPSPTTPVRVNPPLPNKATKPLVTSLSPDLRYEKFGIKLDLHSMNAQGSESESESETDTSRWNQSNLKIKHLQIGSPDVDRMEEPSAVQRESEVLSGLSSYDSSEESESPEDEDESDSLNLDVLLKDNPQLWKHMKDATADVLASRLSTLGLDPTAKGIKSDVLTSCLSLLRKDRRKLEEKHKNFMNVRKKIENEVRAKVDDKIDNADDDSGIHPLSETVKSKRQSGVLSRVVKNVRYKVKLGSQALSTSVSKTGVSVKSGVKDMFHTSTKGDDVRIISRRASTSPAKRPDEDKSSSETLTEDSSSAQVEIHNEISKSVSRSLFGDEPLLARPGARPKQGNYFDNKTYGQKSDSEWDSDPEYENTKAEPPKRTDSLNVSVESADLHDTHYSWDAVESKPIKLKKPTGEMVSSLTRTIESQLSGRRKTKPAGAVDVMGGEDVIDTSVIPGTSQEHSRQNSPYGSRQNLRSVSDSSNTVRTSLWGSATAIDQINPAGPRPSTSKGRPPIHSWDSEDDLDISEIE